MHFVGPNFSSTVCDLLKGVGAQPVKMLVYSEREGVRGHASDVMLSDKLLLAEDQEARLFLVKNW